VFEWPPVIGRSVAAPSQEHAVDFSSSYDINSHLSTRGRFKEQILDLVDFRRRFTLGVHAKW